MRFGASLLLSAVIFATAGCGSELKLQHVAGKATFAGKPIPYGTIEFIPDSARGNKGPPGTAEIINGEFDTRRENGRGVVAGPHTVRISAYEEKPANSSDETAASTAKPPLFIGYTVAVDGFLAEHNFDVPESAKGTDLYKTTPNRPKTNDP
ncbi:MAG TPA: hypothetical protein VFG20_02650 [Planctomycetaceae bacterium]|nr:hypothetical protein [Planctomycetaceae bacterium]